MIFYARYGLDFSDEGHYLNSISNPFLYNVNLPPSFFGLILHPVYDFLGERIAPLRQAGITVTFCLSGLLTYCMLKNFWEDRAKDILPMLAIAAAMASVALVYYSRGLMSPSYNLLNFHGLMIACLGVLLARPEATMSSLTGWALIGIGGWLVLMAKPTSAAALAIVVPLCLLAAGTFRIAFVALSAALAVVLTLAVWIIVDGSPIDAITRYARSIELQYLLGGRHEIASMFRVDSVSYGFQERVIFVPASAFILVAAYLSARLMRGAKAAVTKCCLVVACLAVAVATLFVMMSGYRPGAYPSWVTGQRDTILFPLAFALAATAFAVDWRGVLPPSRRVVALSAMLLVLPHVYAFGTNNRYWDWGASVGFFWLLSGLTFLSLVSRSGVRLAALVPSAFVFPLLATVLLDKGFQYPYRQPPDLRTYDAVHSLDKGGSLILSRGFAEYLSIASRTSREAGLYAGTNVIDLTGQSGALLYALGLNSLGLPWLIGAYPGSNAVASAVLGMESCEVLTRAWLIDEPEGSRRISPEVLRSFGADLSSDYQVAGSFMVPEYAGGRSRDALPSQNLLKPIRDEKVAMAQCSEAMAALR